MGRFREQADETAETLAQLMLNAGSPKASLVTGTRGPYTLREPLTPGDLREHVEGRRRRGIVPVLGEHGELCRLAMVDLDEDILGVDSKRGAEMIVELQQRLAGRGVPAHREMSKSRGQHLWIFLNKAAPIVRMRGLVLAEIRQIDPTWAQKGDAVTPRGTGQPFGNGGWLPCFGGDTGLRTLWLAPDGSAPGDQAGLMRRIHEEGRAAAEVIEAFDGPLEPQRRRRASVPDEVAAMRFAGVFDVLRRMGVRGELDVLSMKGDRARCRCPFHQSGRPDGDTAFLTSEGHFVCMSCGARARSAMQLARMMMSNQERPTDGRSP
jgi:hypothetical protein